MATYLHTHFPDLGVSWLLSSFSVFTLQVHLKPCEVRKVKITFFHIIIVSGKSIRQNCFTHTHRYTGGMHEICKLAFHAFWSHKDLQLCIRMLNIKVILRKYMNLT